MFSKFHRGHWEQERARLRKQPELTSRESYHLWAWLRANRQPSETDPSTGLRKQQLEQQRLLADLLSRSGFDAIVEMAEYADAISEWLPQRFRTEMRISVSDLKAVELLELVRNGVSALDPDFDSMDDTGGGSDNMSFAQRLFAEVGLGGKKVWLLLENAADTEEDQRGPQHKILLEVSAGALDHRVQRLQQLANGWGQTKIQEGLCLHLTAAAEALAWCHNRLDEISEHSARQRPAISEGDEQIHFRDTAFSPKSRSWRRARRRPGLQFFPLRHPERRCQSPSKDEGKSGFPLRADIWPALRVDTVVRREDVPGDLGARGLEAKSQARETTCRRRWAEYQAEALYVTTPVSKEPRFTRSKKAYAGWPSLHKPSARRGALEELPPSVAQMRC
ncbi:unnamed protein product [Symbiodinium pilosum]|uniref:Uncharacterized protein n=1 Tax=Symbiodinium pilosum TaxID=2952 RepID=A0A812TYP3_SYMPI|nr:unnamed protein product [Symbiodinium pilosum]